MKLNTTPLEDIAHDLYDHANPVTKDGFSLPRFHSNPNNPQKPVSRYLEGNQFSTRQTPTQVPYVTFAPDSVGDRPQSLLLQLNGYMQPSTGNITDKALLQNLPVMRALGMLGIGYAQGNRGGKNVLTRNGRYTVGHIQNDVGSDISDILDVTQTAAGRELPVFLWGHSQGGQHALHILKFPEHYGLKREQIRGVILMNAMLAPHSQMMLKTPGFITDIALPSLGNVAKSLITGRGLRFEGQKAFDTFVGEGNVNGLHEKRIIDGLFPDSAAFFAQTVTTGTSPSLKDTDLRDLPISVVISENDQLMAQDLQHDSAEYLRSLGANVAIKNIPGKHFSPLTTFTGESSERVEDIMEANRRAFEHAIQRLV